MLCISLISHQRLIDGLIVEVVLMQCSALGVVSIILCMQDVCDLLCAHASNLIFHDTEWYGQEIWLICCHVVIILRMHVCLSKLAFFLSRSNDYRRLYSVLISSNGHPGKREAHVRVQRRGSEAERNNQARSGQNWDVVLGLFYGARVRSWSNLEALWSRTADLEGKMLYSYYRRGTVQYKNRTVCTTYN